MKKPNLLFIYTDEQAHNTLAVYGNTQIEMPNLNRLADHSCVFQQAYVTQPVCTPSRSTLLTGQWPHTNGCTANNIPLHESTRCLPEMIDDTDYVTAHMGKWHLGDEIFKQHGFDEWISIDDAYAPYYSEQRDKDALSTYHQFLTEKGFTPERGRAFNRSQCCRLPEEVGKPAYLAMEASRFICENKNKPFILFVNFFEPHMPYFGPRDNQYDLADIPLPPNFTDEPGQSQPLKHRAFREVYHQKGHSGLSLKTENDWKRLIANYWGQCSLVDTHAGTILDALDECGLTDDTIIVYTSDHGDMMGSHRLTAKCVMYEEASRVPFLLKIPRQKKQKVITGPVSQIDIVPTILDLMGQKLPDEVEGNSLKSYLNPDAANFLDQDIIVEWQGANTGAVGEAVKGFDVPERMKEEVTAEDLGRSITAVIRTIVTADGWKFCWSSIGENELYNLNDDAHEMSNLADSPELADLINELKARIRSWMEENDDTIGLEAFV